MSDDCSIDEYSDDVFFEEYERRIGVIGEKIVEALEEHDVCDARFDGYEFFEETGIPESVVVDAVNARSDSLEWGVTPMYPWLHDD